MSKLFCFIFCLIFFSCTDNCDSVKKEVQALMKDKYKKRMIFPDNIEMLTDSSVVGGGKDIQKIIMSKRVTVFHFFTADCDKCINELSHIKVILKKLPKDTTVAYIFLASSPSKKYLVDAIAKLNFSYPIFYEKKYYSFKNINNLPLSDQLYNTMLLNNQMEVILFGSFFNNQKAKDLFQKVIACDL
jgi:hypothetical protein